MATALNLLNLAAAAETARRAGKLTLTGGATIAGNITQDQQFYQVAARFPVTVVANGADGLDVTVDDTSIIIVP